MTAVRAPLQQLNMPGMYLHPLKGATHYGRGYSYSVREVVEAVKQVSGVDFAVRIGERRAGDPARLVAANARIKAAFGWQPRGTSLDEITRSALAWERRLLETTR